MSQTRLSKVHEIFHSLFSISMSIKNECHSIVIPFIRMCEMLLNHHFIMFKLTYSELLWIGMPNILYNIKMIIENSDKFFVHLNVPHIQWLYFSYNAKFEFKINWKISADSFSRLLNFFFKWATWYHMSDSGLEKANGKIGSL